jgi:hypothetical protein
MSTRNDIIIKNYHRFHQVTGQSMTRWKVIVTLGCSPTSNVYVFAANHLSRKDAVSDILEKLRAIERATQRAIVRIQKPEKV